MSTPTDLEQLRTKKREIEQYLPEIEQKKDICNQLTENITYEKQKLQSIKKEIQFRSHRLSELHAQYRAITEKGALNSKKQIEDIKTQIIKEKLEELLAQKIPEANIQTNKVNKNNLKENEFQNLIHSNIKIIYTKYESPLSKVKKEEVQFFRISSHTKFSTLKEAACHYWRIENANDFVFTDDAEAIIYNEDYLINDYMKNYSVRANMIKLISSSLLRARPKLTLLQEDRLKEENAFKVKSRFEVKQRESGSNSQKVNEFIYAYSGLTPYYLIKDEQNRVERELERRSQEAKEAETSFIMLLLSFFLFVLTIVMIYVPSKSVWLNFTKKTYMKQILQGSPMQSYDDLYRYIVFTLGSKLFSNETEPNSGLITDLFQCNTAFINAIKKSEPLNSPFYRYIKTNANPCTHSNPDFDVSEYLNDASVSYHLNPGFRVLNAVHLIVSRVNRLETCSKEAILGNIENEQCYKKFYSKKSQSKVAINHNGNEGAYGTIVSISSYQTSRQAGVHIALNSESGYFNGDGYHADIPLGKNFLEYIKAFESLIPVQLSTAPTVATSFLVDNNVRGLTFLLNVYFPNEDILGNIIVHINFFASGGMALNEIEVKLFTATIYKSGYLVVDIIRLIIIILMIFFILLDFYLTKKEFKTLLSINYFLYVFILGWFLACFIIKLAYCDKSNKDFLENTSAKYVDASSIAEMSENTFYLESILLIFQIMRALMFFRLTNVMTLLFVVIQKSFLMFIQYLVVLIVMFMGFAVIAEIIWSPFLESYKTFGASFVSVLLFTCGYFDTYSLMHYNLIWAFFFIAFVFLFNLFFIFIIFNSIFAESLRRTVITFGYPHDRDKSQWSMRDYMIWIIHFVRDEKIEKKE